MNPDCFLAEGGDRYLHSVSDDKRTRQMLHNGFISCGFISANWTRADVSWLLLEVEDELGQHLKSLPHLDD